LIQLRIVSIRQVQSSEVNTVRYIHKGEETTTEKTYGGIWEEIEFAIVPEDKPVIQIANVTGDGFLVGSPIKLIINNPDLFGSFKVGDVIDFVPTRVQKVAVKDNTPTKQSN
jgi:hypothetical protein